MELAYPYPGDSQLYPLLPSKWSLFAPAKACPARGDDRDQSCPGISYLNSTMVSF